MRRYLGHEPSTRGGGVGGHCNPVSARGPRWPRRVALPSPRTGSRSVVAAAVAVAALLTASVLAAPAGAVVGPTNSVGLTSCQDQTPKLTVVGSQAERYRQSVSTATAIDARTAKWLQVAAMPVALSGPGGICWTGGVIQGTFPATM